MPYPYGGKQRYVSVDLNYQKLQAVGMTPTDVVNALTAQNVILPSGTMKIGPFEYQVFLNASPPTIEELNAIPVKSMSNGSTIYIRDVANVRNCFIPQTNIVRFDGSRATMLDIQKIGSASTLDIVQGERIHPGNPQTHAQEFPDIEFWFPPSNIVAQILNFGLPAPINVQVQGLDTRANYQFASRLMNQMRAVPGLVDLHIQEPNTVPRFDIAVDRTKASMLGMQEQNVANSVLGALAGSQQVNPNFWVDPKNGVTYQVTAQEPQYQMDSLDALRNLPILGGTGVTPKILANVAHISRSDTSSVVDHYNIRPVINIYGNVDGKDLGYVSKQVQQLVDAAKKDIPKGSLLIVRDSRKRWNPLFQGCTGDWPFRLYSFICWWS